MQFNGARGAISLGRAAELLNLTPHDILRIAQQKGIRTGASPEQITKSGEILQRLTEKRGHSELWTKAIERIF